jgi:FdhE protein
MRQAQGPPSGKWTGNPSGGVKAPEPLILPDPATGFARSAVRLAALSAAHPMADWLRFTGQVADAQHVVATTLAPRAVVAPTVVERAVDARLPPIGVDTHRRDPIWHAGLSRLLDTLEALPLADQPRAAITRLRGDDADAIEALAVRVLCRDLDVADLAGALYVAAALQVYFTLTAANLRATSLRLLPQRGLCPCCGSMPVAGIVTATGPTPGSRYLHCSICATAWNHVRAVCITCGDSRTLAQRGIEGDAGAVKAETCDACHTYAKMFYEAHDTQVDPFADDLASLGLDLLIADAGWSRHAMNPWLLIGSER